MRLGYRNPRRRARFLLLALRGPAILRGSGCAAWRIARRDNDRVRSVGKGAGGRHPRRMQQAPHDPGAVRGRRWVASESVYGDSKRLLEDMSLDGLQWLCRELGIHWHRVILSL